MQYTSREVYEYVSKQTNDPIVERRRCAISGQEFAVYASDDAFYAKISPTFDGKKFPIPRPTLCPEERQRRRLLFRNERKLYKRKCDATGESIISMYSADKTFPVYKQPFWRSDSWSASSYAVDYDPALSFSEQYKKLLHTVPKDALIKEFIRQENSDYTNSAGIAKNCYMCFEMAFCEDVYNAEHVFYVKDSADCSYGFQNQQTYECVNCLDSTKLFYSMLSSQCTDSYFLYSCNNCTSCFMCFNLQNQQYCIGNKQYTKEEYEVQVAAYKKDLVACREQFVWMLDTPQVIKKAVQWVNNERVFGTFVNNSFNSVFVSDCDAVRDCKYCAINNNCQDCMDYDSRGENASLVYESEECGRNISNVWFSLWCRENVHNVRYSYYCLNLTNCFGCVWLRNKEYCIFNKQYTKEEYEKTVAAIITDMQSRGERGEFTHPAMSAFGYNETVAQEYFPLAREEALARWYARLDVSYDPVIPTWVKTVDASALSDDQKKAMRDSDDTLKEIFICSNSKRPYRLVKPELEFYRKYDMPLPTKHPDVRHAERMKLRPWRELYVRTCDKTGEEMVSVYPASYAGKVYSEEAYKKEVY